MTSRRGKKQLQYTYYAISQEAKTMRIGQLIEYSMRNIFREKSYTKCCEETIPRLFSKKSNLNISLNQQPKVLDSYTLLYAELRAIEID